MVDTRGIADTISAPVRAGIPGLRSDDAERFALQGRVLTTKVGLHITARLSFDEWTLAGRRLSGLVDSSCWWLGDWLVYGREQYSDRYQRGIEAVGLQYQTLRNYAWVARRFPKDRRHSALTFQHHSELASLPDEEQDQWLEQAEQRGWTTRQLRLAVRNAQLAGPPEPAADKPEKMKKLAVPGSRVDWWHKAAERAGVSFEQWVLSALDHAAELILDVG